MNMFNNRGEINASSLKDALQQVVKFAAVLEDNSPANLGFSGQSSLSDDRDRKSVV